MKLLITGFEPFDGEEINPSALVAEKIQVEGVQVKSLILPTEFGHSTQIIIAAVKEFQPDWVVMLGQAAGRTHITPERVAINMDDASIPDNRGHQPKGQPITMDGPNAWFSTLPIKEMVTAMRNAGVPASISNTAGTYVCNHVFYGMMHFLNTNRIKARAGFIHIPSVPAQVLEKPLASMDLDLICKGLERALRAMVDINYH